MMISAVLTACWGYLQSAALQFPDYAGQGVLHDASVEAGEEGRWKADSLQSLQKMGLCCAFLTIEAMLRAQLTLSERCTWGDFVLMTLATTIEWPPGELLTSTSSSLVLSTLSISIG